MTEIIRQPGPNDVLCGRGGATNNHEGNKRFRRLVHDHQPEYLNTKKRDKRSIARAIVAIVKRRGGTFLKKVDPGSESWCDVGDQKATDKTSQALREGLDVRRGVQAPRRQRARDGPDGSSPADEQQQQQPPKKRRRTTKPASAAAASSPALVPEFDLPADDGFAFFSLGFSEEELCSDAAVFETAPLSVEDVGEIVAL